jgi:uncharacterized membrane protein
MQIRLESAKRLGKKLGLNEEKGFAVAIFLALLIVSVAVLSYFVWFKPLAEPYNTIYLLDSNKKALDYPETLVVNQNSTFNVYVDVVNHLGYPTSYQVQMKITKNLSTFPVDVPASQVFEINSLEGNGQTKENTATITENTVGGYSVVFELWQQNLAGTYEFTHNYCVLNIQVTN